MLKLLSAFLLATRLASPAVFSFTDVEVSFSGTELSVSSTPTTVAGCDHEVPACPNGTLAIGGLLLNGRLAVSGEHQSQSLTEGLLTFDIDGEDPLTARILEASLIRSSGEALHGHAEILNPLWLERLGTALLALHIALDGNLQLSGDQFGAFRTTTQLWVTPVVEDVLSPEPASFALAGTALLSAVVARLRNRRR